MNKGAGGKNLPLSLFPGRWLQAELTLDTSALLHVKVLRTTNRNNQKKKGEKKREAWFTLVAENRYGDPKETEC